MSLFFSLSCLFYLFPYSKSSSPCAYCSGGLVFPWENREPTSLSVLVFHKPKPLKKVSWPEDGEKLDIFVSQGCQDCVLKHKFLKQQKFTASEFWRLEVQNQGVSRARLLGRVVFLPLQLLHLLPALSFPQLLDSSFQAHDRLLPGVPSMHVYLCV